MDPFAKYHDEQRAAYLYECCARAEAGTVRGELFSRFAGEAQARAAIARARITSRGLPPPPPFTPDLRARCVARLIGTLGPRRMRAALAAMKVRGMAVYAARAAEVPSPVPMVAATPPAPDPVATTLPPAPDAPTPGGATPATGSNLRTTMLGVNDGLVVNASLILGVAGAGSDPKVVLVSGVAGLAAGAFAAAAGEFTSGRTQRDLRDGQVAHERATRADSPAREVRELAHTCAAKNTPPREAARLAGRSVADPRAADETRARCEPGLDRNGLASPIARALGALLAFAAGAAIPALAYAVAPVAWELPLMLGGTTVALVALGATPSLHAGRGAWAGALRALALAAAAGAATYAIGRIVGAALG